MPDSYTPAVRGLGVAIALAAAILVGAASFSAVRLAQVSTQPLSVTMPPAQQHILILGYGGGDHPGAYLSDSMMLVVNDGTRQAELSIPRDLWMPMPGSNARAKINDALQLGYNAGGIDAGGDMAAKAAANVTGMTITGWVLQDFDGFRQMVDALGGVDVNVQRTFSAQYPVNDDPDIDPSWKIVHFDAGPHHMDGERALEFARARYADNPAEASDFARSQRQQLLVAAIRQKVASPAGALHFLPLVNAVAAAVHTNLPPTELAGFVSGFHPETAKHLALDDTNVLVDGKSADGQDILLPKNGDYNLIATYVKQQLA
ncbi:MAG TPA: LCP family protein [Chloroflexota bacterium]|nr:LCP family protein [Chloroflexota bacterium]